MKRREYNFIDFSLLAIFEPAAQRTTVFYNTHRQKQKKSLFIDKITHINYKVINGYKTVKPALQYLSDNCEFSCIVIMSVVRTLVKATRLRCCTFN